MTAKIDTKIAIHSTSHRSFYSGLAKPIAVACLALYAESSLGGSAMVYALLLGMLLKVAIRQVAVNPGTEFAATRILRIGVGLLGARITLEHFEGLGWLNGGLIIVAVLATLGFGIIVSRALGLSRRLGILTGGATAICGASAALAIAAVLPRDERSERELIFTVVGVTGLSSIAMIFYPLIASGLNMHSTEAGIFLGATIHGVAQAVGAGYSLSSEAGDHAVIAKMLRVTMLLPIVIALSIVINSRSKLSAAGYPPLLPRFLIGFTVLMVAGSSGWIAPDWLPIINRTSNTCLVVAIAATGLSASLTDITKIGFKPVILLLSEALFLIGLISLILMI